VSAVRVVRDEIVDLGWRLVNPARRWARRGRDVAETYRLGYDAGFNDARRQEDEDGLRPRLRLVK
jgi:hypothetical protein